jgi:hypothetical protein
MVRPNGSTTSPEGPVEALPRPPTLDDLIAEHGQKKAIWLWDKTRQRALHNWRKKMSEELIASAGSSLSIPTHAEGQFPAVCIDIVDLGIVEMTWQGNTRRKHRMYLRFFCGETFTDDEGQERPLWVDQYFTVSLHENSALRPFLEKWRGKRFTAQELRGFNLMQLLHVPAYVQIAHNTKGEKTYANVDSVMRLPKGMEAPAVPESYVRVKDREYEDEDQSADGATHPGNPNWPEDDDDMPF